MRDKIKVLFLAADPLDVDYRPLLGKEAREIEQKIRVGTDREYFDFDMAMAVRPSDLQSILVARRPNIVHFSGHGSKAQGIMLEDDQGQKKMVSGRALANLFKHLKSDVRLIFLNACHSKRQAQALRNTIDYTIGMKDTVGDNAAIVFAATFYGGLASGYSVKEAFELARTQLELEGLSDVETPELLVRKGVDISAPLLVSLGVDQAPEGPAKSSPKKERVSAKSTARLAKGSSPARRKQTAMRRPPRQVKAMLERLVCGTAAEEDQFAVRRDVVDGEVVFCAVDGGEVTAADSKTLIKVVTENNHVLVELSGAAYEQAQKRLFPPPPGIAPPRPPLMFVGRKDAVAEVRQLLVSARSSPCAGNVVIVRGMPGVGKTALAGVIGHDVEVAKAFPGGVLWASLDQRPDLPSELARWGRALGTDELLRAPTLTDAAARLSALLRGRRMLLIVDGVRDEAHATPFLQARGDDCALLMTTREARVVEALTDASRSIYVLPVLSEDDALKLIRILAPAAVGRHPDECRELVRSLECLPLALQVAGRLLKSEAKPGWGVADLLKDISEGAKPIISGPALVDRVERKTIPAVSALLKKSTDMLDLATQECFAFLGVFAARPATFDMKAMKAVWRVEDPESAARKLVDHGLLEPVGSGRFQVHALLAQHARSMLTE